MQMLDESNPPFYRWYPDGITNACYNAVDIHVHAGRGDQPAVIHDSPVTRTQRSISYKELLDEVSRFAGVLSAQGVSTGDRVIIINHEQMLTRNQARFFCTSNAPATRSRIALKHDLQKWLKSDNRDSSGQTQVVSSNWPIVTW